MNFRKEWFNHVATVRKRLARKNKAKGCTHKNAMAQASISWPKEKAKLQRKAVREAKQTAKAKTVSASSPPVPQKEDAQS
jgi:hypothetical protein